MCRFASVCLLGMILAIDALADQADKPVIFYLHGQIIEDQGPRPISQYWGLYDYPAVVDALGSRGASVISEVRDSGTDVREYARQVVRQITDLISDGMPPEQIVVVGFSKGGAIAVFVSSYLNNSGVRYILLAACGDWMHSLPDIRLTGHILSVVEESDRPGRRCSDLASRNENIESFRELTISTGREHGAFYLPRAEWLDPVLDWIG